MSIAPCITETERGADSMIFSDYDRIVFAGDSITDMGSVQPVGDGSMWDNLGKSYVRIVDNMLAAYYPEIRVRVTNSGVNGDSSADLLKRFKRDVIDLDPQWISILIGGNDCWRQFDSPSQRDQHIAPDEYGKNVERMLQMSTEKSGVKGIFVLSPYYMEPLREDPMRARMEEYADVCRDAAKKYSAEFVDIQSVFDRYFNYRHSSFIAWDRIHPNLIGATLIAREFLAHCGFDPLHIPE